MNKLRKLLTAGLLASTIAVSGCSLLPHRPNADTPIETVAVANQVVRSAVVELRNAYKLNRITTVQAEVLQGKLEYAYGLIVLAEEAAKIGDTAGSQAYLAVISELLLAVERELGNVH